MSKPTIEIITWEERRRRWSTGEKERLVAASLERGAISAVAREAGIHPGQLYGWRRQLLRRSPPTATFAAVQIAAEPAAAALSAAQTPTINIRVLCLLPPAADITPLHRTHSVLAAVRLMHVCLRDAQRDSLLVFLSRTRLCENLRQAMS
jgi:transposase-like protein